MKILNEAFDRVMIESELNTLLEAMSPEDEADTKLIRSVLRKIQARKNAALTKEEKEVLAKYNIKNNGYGQLFVTSEHDPHGYYHRSELRSPEEESPKTYDKRYWTRHNHPDEVNLADIARKRGKRLDRDVYMVDDHDNITVLAQRGRRGLTKAAEHDYTDETSQSSHRKAVADVMQNNIHNLSAHLIDRKAARQRLGTVDAKFDKKDKDAAEKYMDTLAYNARQRNWEKRYYSDQETRSQKRIDDLLAKRRMKTEGVITETGDGYLNSSLYKVSRYCMDIEELLKYIENLISDNELLLEDAELLLNILRRTFDELEDRLAKINTVEE